MRDCHGTVTTLYVERLDDDLVGVDRQRSGWRTAVELDVTTAPRDGLRFVPNEVQGLPAVTEVAVFPDRLELLSDGEWVVVRLIDIARWHRAGWFYRRLAALGWVRGWPSVADRMWFPRPGVSWFRFYSTPGIVIHVPYYPTDVGHMDTVFQRVKQVMAAGGFITYDLG